MSVVGIYLAAGNSRRMGTDKLALPIGKMALGSLALDTAVQSTLKQIYIVAKEGDELSWLPNRLRNHEKCTVLPCSNAGDGQSVSLRCGISHAKNFGASAAVVLLADQPFITAAMIDEMLKCWNSHPTSKYVATTYEGTMKPPILFSSEVFPILLNIKGDKGARELLHGTLFTQGKRLPCMDHRLLFDVDTPDDYNLLLTEQLDEEK